MSLLDRRDMHHLPAIDVRNGDILHRVHRWYVVSVGRGVDHDGFPTIVIRASPMSENNWPSKFVYAVGDIVRVERDR